jgi:hypothetical protein
MSEDYKRFMNIFKTVLLIETDALLADAINDLSEDHCDHDKDEN